MFVQCPPFQQSITCMTLAPRPHHFMRSSSQIHEEFICWRCFCVYFGSMGPHWFIAQWWKHAILKWVSLSQRRRRGRRARQLSPCVILLLLCFPSAIRSQVAATETCPRGALGSAVVAPQDLRSQNGVLRVNLALRSFRDAQGYFRYCYVDAEGHQAPTLRLQPGDLLILQLTNELSFVPQLNNAQ